MTKELIDAMSLEDLEARKAEIGDALDGADENQIDAFIVERGFIDSRIEQIKQELAKQVVND